MSLNPKTIDRHICLDVTLVRLKDFTLKARVLITAKTRDTLNICHDLYGKICKINLSAHIKEKLSNRERTVFLTPMKTYDVLAFKSNQTWLISILELVESISEANPRRQSIDQLKL